MVLKYCGVAICILVCVMVLRIQKGEGAFFVSLGGGIILLVAAFSRMIPAFEFVNEIIANSGFGGYFSVLLKAMGVTLAVQLTSELCRDAGESGIAAKLELAGKTEVLILCLPLIKELLLLAAEIVNI